MKAYSISVPTKQSDGETTPIRNLVGGSQQQQEQDDAFWAGVNNNLVHLNRYNNKRRRVGNNSRCIKQKQGNKRKTRLSWELHPTLLRHDLELELEGLDNGSHRIVNDDEEASGTGKKPQQIQEQQSPEEKE
jgi:hypothetical protein